MLTLPRVMSPDKVITLNGQQTQLAVESLADLMVLFRLGGGCAAIALNNEVIPSAEYLSTPIHDGDQIEIVTASCGG